MSEIKMPSDDAARVINTRALANRTVHPTEPAPTAHPVQPHEEAPVVQPVPRAKQQRRRGERRRKNVPVLLDTRSGGDRRGGELTDDAAPEDEDPERKGPGIDVFV